MIDLAVFGAGRIGGVHARNAARQPRARLKYVVDPVASAAREQLLAETGAQLVESEVVFADAAIAGVVIASPTDTHAALILSAIETGKPLFCEKPISLDFPTVVKIAQKVEASGVPCMLGFQRRYDPNFRRVRDRIASGDAGALEQIVMHTRDPSPPPVSYIERSGGMFRDQAIHDFDMARYFAGEDIATVYAVGGSMIDPAIAAAGDIDCAMITLLTRSGKQISMNNQRRAPFGYDQRLEAFCAKESFFIENRLGDNVTVGAASGYLAAAPMNHFIERFAEAYRAEMEAFVAMILSGQAPLAVMSDGLEAQRLAEAAIVSMNTGAPVTVRADWRPALAC
jgi:myo-inositol 2-dehydrogenase / D-chiro-inositol 1-dehydrogenase